MLPLIALQHSEPDPMRSRLGNTFERARNPNFWQVLFVPGVETVWKMCHSHHLQSVSLRLYSFDCPR